MKELIAGTGIEPSEFTVCIDRNYLMDRILQDFNNRMDSAQYVKLDTQARIIDLLHDVLIDYCDDIDGVLGEFMKKGLKENR